jgi:hypothetical protein
MGFGADETIFSKSFPEITKFHPRSIRCGTFILADNLIHAVLKLAINAGCAQFGRFYCMELISCIFNHKQEGD